MLVAWPLAVRLLLRELDTESRAAARASRERITPSLAMELWAALVAVGGPRWSAVGWRSSGTGGSRGRGVRAGGHGGGGSRRGTGG